MPRVLTDDAGSFKEAIEVGNARNKQLDDMTEKARQRIAKGESAECTVKVLLDDDKNNLSSEDLCSISNSMVSSGVGRCRRFDLGSQAWLTLAC